MTTFLSNDQLNAAAQVALQSVPAGHTNAIVGSVDATGVQVVSVFKLDQDRWTATIMGRHDWSGDNSVGANVVYSW